MPRTAHRRRGRRVPDIAEPSVITGVRREIPTYDLMREEGLEMIEAHSERLLSEIGVRFIDDPEALTLWHEAGAEVSGDRVRFPPGLLRGLLRTAPKLFHQHARNPARTIELGGNNVVFAPAYGMPFVSDLDNGRRYGTIRDFRKPDQACLRFALAASFRRNDLRADGSAGEQTTSGHGLCPPQMERQTIHGFGDRTRACSGQYRDDAHRFRV